MKDLIDQYGLELKLASSDSVLFKGNGFSLFISIEPEGVSTTYFNTVTDPPLGYDVVTYIVNKRAGQLPAPGTDVKTSYQDFITQQIRSTAQIFRSAGRDILSGDRDWLTDYNWPRVEPGQLHSFL